SAPAGASVRLMPTNIAAGSAPATAGFVSTDSWTETGITWNNKPASTTTLNNWPVQQAAPVKFDASSLIGPTITGDKLLSPRVFSNTISSGVNQFAAREWTDGQLRPMLVLKNLMPQITGIPAISGSTNTATPPMW